MYLMMTNVMVKTCLNQKIIKNSSLIQAITNSVCPTANVSRRPIFPTFPNCEFNTRHDNREVTLIEFFEGRICAKYLPNVPKCRLNTRHDNREVTLIHLTRAQTLRSEKCATGSIHANGSMTINVIPC